MTTVQILLLAAIVLSIALGFITRVNTGLYALVFSYFIGSFVMLLSPGTIVKMWPMRICVILASVSFFYNFAINNGTLEKLALNIVYKFKKTPYLFPYAIYLTAILVSAMGAGFYAVVALLCPLTFTICAKTGMNKLLGAMAVIYGAVAGGNLITTATGSVIVSVIEDAITGKTVPMGATQYGMNVFYSTVVVTAISLTIFYFVFKGHKLTSDTITIEKPAPYDARQKTSLRLIIAFIIIVMIPYIISMIFPESRVLYLISRYLDVGFISILLGIISILLKVGSEKEAIVKIPWSIIIMISGVGVLIALAVEAGTIDVLATWVNGIGSPLLIVLIMTTLGGLMSIFSSTVGVVLPTLYPIVPGIAAATGLSANLLFMVIQLGSLATGISPYSSAGGLVMGSAPDEDTRQFLYPRLLIMIPVSLVILLVMVTVMYFIIG